jgi:Tol biopolymer transport system component
MGKAKALAENFQPAFSPDGNSIAFVSTRASRTRMVKIGQRSANTETRIYGGDVWVVPTLGGQASWQTVGARDR